MKTTRENILNHAKKLFARNGYEGFSMRLLAKESGAGASSIYHFFQDKDEILTELFDQIRKELGTIRAQLPEPSSAREMLRQRIVFQFNNIEDVIFILKYYLHFRDDFLKNKSGYIPEKAYLHIIEVLEKGRKTGEIHIEQQNIVNEAKNITHAINGFLLEYYPNKPEGRELDETVDAIHKFTWRSLTNKEVSMI